jgi:hypothetical protein
MFANWVFSDIGVLLNDVLTTHFYFDDSDDDYEVFVWSIMELIFFFMELSTLDF